MRVLPTLCLALACVAANCGNSQLAAEPIATASPSDRPAQLNVELKPVQTLGVEIGAPSGKLPPNYGALRLAREGIPAGVVLQRTWPVMSYHWTASASRHNPLYFEEINAERYGYTCGRCLQPVVSAAHFFGTIPALPYLMAADCPRECVYTLGHYRPGNCNPYRKHWWPCRLDAAAVEAGTAVGIIAILP
ncbi:hypothetical protein Pla123a_14250 [Posidoniimonas polymericola]|uniref:Uncharacterized protein n=1 Tax=Posidoniimonas polymericola TaxID=2528002 RepID=A0A5C5YRV3_9BACT|nr:hypothetical protein [Posidoniimonas polymericola]TWT77629.1 hypothetical protein Pla123a_14250 [Posidoniimonas polymericola]